MDALKLSSRMKAMEEILASGLFSSFEMSGFAMSTLAQYGSVHDVVDCKHEGTPMLWADERPLRFDGYAMTYVSRPSCAKHEAIDTGWRTSECKHCSTPMRFVDMRWVAE